MPSHSIFPHLNASHKWQNCRLLVVISLVFFAFYFLKKTTEEGMNKGCLCIFDLFLRVQLCRMKLVPLSSDLHAHSKNICCSKIYSTERYVHLKFKNKRNTLPWPDSTKVIVEKIGVDFMKNLVGKKNRETMTIAK